jgi:hypothetical protein
LGLLSLYPTVDREISAHAAPSRVLSGVGFEAVQVPANYMVGCIWPSPILMILAIGVGSSPLGLDRVDVT